MNGLGFFLFIIFMVFVGILVYSNVKKSEAARKQKEQRDNKYSGRSSDETETYFNYKKINSEANDTSNYSKPDSKKTFEPVKEKPIYAKSQKDVEVKKVIDVEEDVEGTKEEIELDYISDGNFVADFEKYEIYKYYRANGESDNARLINELRYIVKDIDNEIFTGIEKITENSNYKFYEISVKDPKNSKLSSFFFSDKDIIKMNIFVDVQKNLLSLNILKDTASGFSIKEFGSFLFNGTTFQNVSYGISQFSYYKAGDLLKIFMNSI